MTTAVSDVFQTPTKDDVTSVHTSQNISQEALPLTVIAYSDFTTGDAKTIEALKKALLEQGIVGISGIPGLKGAEDRFVSAARTFSDFSEEVKGRYAPNRDVEYLGYELAKEKFRGDDGVEVVDDSKASYYALVPDHDTNKWPKELDLRTPLQEVGAMMAENGKAVMEKIGLLNSGVTLDEHQVGRMLSYRNREGRQAKRCWCGEHYDHGLFTALLSATYFEQGTKVSEPQEAGLFVKATNDSVFKKVVVNDPDIMLFQVGEFGQLATNDRIKATKHRVDSAPGAIERYTMALFFSATMDCTITSTSELAKDERYGEGPSCTFEQWHTKSLARYHAK
jgi:isopenicillin N synthase-like dioxygenase